MLYKKDSKWWYFEKMDNDFSNLVIFEMVNEYECSEVVWSVVDFLE